MQSAPLFRGWSLTGCYAAMLVIGLLLSVYGPIVTVLQGRFDLSGAAVGAALGTQSFGAVIGVLLAQRLLRARGNRATLMVALLFIAIGAAVIAAAPIWPLVLSGTAIAGLGFGGVDSIVTQLILVGSGTKGPGRVNIAHAWFGIGTVAGPGLIYLVGPGNYPGVFTGAAVVALLALISTVGLAPRPTPADSTAQARTREAPAPGHKPGKLGIVIVAFFALYLTHFAVQAGIGNWAPTVMEQQSGIDTQTTTLFISGFWAAMVIGRFAAAILTRHATPGAVVTFSSIGLAAAVALTVVPVAAPWAYLAAGLFLGPIFPTGLAWLSASGYGRGNNFAYVIAGSMIGMTIAPSLVGATIGQWGTGIAPLILLSITVLVAASSIALLVLIARPRQKATADSKAENRAVLASSWKEAPRPPESSRSR